MKQEPRFGISPPGRCISSNYQAWMQCVELLDEECELRKQADQENKTCSDRAAARSERESRARELARRDLERFDKMQAQGQKLSSHYSKLRDLIESPKKFIVHTLTEKGKTMAYEATLRTVFPSAVGAEGPDRMDLAELIYKHALGYAKSKAPNEFIGAIQGTALDAIDAQFNSVFGQMDQALLQMKNFQAEAATMTFPSSNVVPVQEDHSHGHDSAECGIFKTPEALRRLRDSDPEKLLTLTEKCTN